MFFFGWMHVSWSILHHWPMFRDRVCRVLDVSPQKQGDDGAFPRCLVLLDETKRKKTVRIVSIV